jgi:hypothetical protein
VAPFSMVTKIKGAKPLHLAASVASCLEYLPLPLKDFEGAQCRVLPDSLLHSSVRSFTHGLCSLYYYDTHGLPSAGFVF